MSESDVKKAKGIGRQFVLCPDAELIVKLEEIKNDRVVLTISIPGTSFTSSKYSAEDAAFAKVSLELENEVHLNLPPVFMRRSDD